MSTNNFLYLFIIVLFAVSFFGLVLSDGSWIFYIGLVTGVLLFLARIARGDD